MRKKKKKLLLRAGFAIFFVVLLMNSVYFGKLDSRKRSAAQGDFDPAVYARDFWENKLPAVLADALDMSALREAIISGDRDTLRSYSRSVSIGNASFVLVQGRLRVTSIEQNEIVCAYDEDRRSLKVIFPARLIFSSAIRDASGLIDINDFSSTLEYNAISTEINKIVLDRVIPPFLEEVATGAEIQFFGAVELSGDESGENPIKVIPILLRIL